MNVALIAYTLSLFNLDLSICTAKAAQAYPRALFADGNYYVLWSDSRFSSDYALFVCRISASGKVLDPNGKLLFKRKAAYQPAAAFDGKSFLAVFRDGC